MDHGMLVFLQGDNGPENNEELSKEELGRFVASRWTGEKIEKESEADSIKDNNPKAYEQEETPEDTYDEDDGGYASEPYYEDKKDEYGDADNYMDEDWGADDHVDRNIHYQSESDDESDLGLCLHQPFSLWASCSNTILQGIII